MAYHTIVLPADAGEANLMGSIRQLVLECNTAGVFGWLVATNDPGSSPYLAPFPANRWCKSLSVRTAASGAALANAVAVEIWGGRDRVMVDEVNTDPVFNARMKDCADILGSNPTFWGRWGAYVIRAGSVSVLQDCQPALDACLRASASIVYEAYVKHSTYCNQHTTNPGMRDQWLGNYFKDRMDYIVARRSAVSYPGWPLSYIHPVFGVTDFVNPPGLADIAMMNCTNPNVFLDRMFYVWRTRSGYPGSINHGFGGVGSWKWEHPMVGTSSRDDFFRDSWNWYCRDGNSGSRMPSPPPCDSCT